MVLKGSVSGHLSFRSPSSSSAASTASSSAPLHSLIPLHRHPSDAWSRHQKYIRDFVRFYGDSNRPAAAAQSAVTDADLLLTEHRFLRDAGEDARTPDTYEKRLAKKYYDKLFKEYALADLTHYRDGRVGMRWRTEAEVFLGKGQFVCGGKHCDERERLHSYEVNFAYTEHGQPKNALVKLRLCETCAGKLNYKHQKRKDKEREKQERKRQRTDDETRSEEDAAAETGSAPPATESVSTAATPVTTDEQNQTASVDASATAASASASVIWTQKRAVERTREDEFEEYFRDLFP